MYNYNHTLIGKHVVDFQIHLLDILSLSAAAEKNMGKYRSTSSHFTQTSASGPTISRRQWRPVPTNLILRKPSELSFA